MWQWYETAAVQGDARAQTNLGVRYQNGQGMPEDSVRAYIYIMWYSLAQPTRRVMRRGLQQSIEL